MLYHVRARPITKRMVDFHRILTDGTVAGQRPDGREIIDSMKRAIVIGNDVEWYETCYCNPPLRHERQTVYDKFFAEMRIETVQSTPRLAGASFWDELARSAGADSATGKA